MVDVDTLVLPLVRKHGVPVDVEVLAVAVVLVGEPRLLREPGLLEHAAGALVASKTRAVTF